MLEHLILMLSLLGSGHAGTGTIFGSSRWDRSNPHSRLACYHREISDRDLVVAHNTLPCGSRVWIFNPRTGKSVVASVGDRGPKHAYVDMSREVAARIAHNGRELVYLVALPHPTRVQRESVRSMVEGDPDRPPWMLPETPPDERMWLPEHDPLESRPGAPVAEIESPAAVLMALIAATGAAGE